MQDFEIRKRLFGAIERVGMAKDRERVCKYAADLLVPEVKKLIQEQVRESKSKEQNT